MTRPELQTALARAVRARRLTPEEAAEVLRAFDAGELDGLPPGTEEEAADRTTRDVTAAAALLALLALYARTVGTPSGTRVQRVTTARLWLRRLDAVQRRTLFTRALVAFDDRVAALARSGLSGQALADALIARVRQDVMQQATLGLGRALTDAEARALRRRVGSQVPYARAFAAEIEARRLAGRPFSDAYVLDRMRQYAAPGIETYWRAAEADAVGRPGWVSQYVAVDDGGTCTSCSRSQGYWLPGQGPFPGDVCEAAGKCRCRRLQVFDPTAYRALLNEQRKAA